MSGTIPHISHKDSSAFRPARVGNERNIVPDTRKLSFSRPRERRNDKIPQNSTRAPAIKGKRFPLHKHSVSTYPFLLLSAFRKTSLFREISAIPRPCLKKQGRRGGAFPWGGSSLPEGRTFRIPFPSSGKVSPARGAQNKQLLLIKNQKQNFTPLPFNSNALLHAGNPEKNRRTRSVQLKPKPFPT